MAEATDLVGYGLYLDLLGPSREGQTRHAFDLGEEEDRARAALDLAAAGRRVALISSGDAGIYAMAALVFELLEREGRPAWILLQNTDPAFLRAQWTAFGRTLVPSPLDTVFARYTRVGEPQTRGGSEWSAYEVERVWTQY